MIKKKLSHYLTVRCAWDILEHNIVIASPNAFKLRDELISGDDLLLLSHDDCCDDKEREEESYANEFVDLVFQDDDDDFGNRINLGSHKEHPENDDDDDENEKEKKDEKKVNDVNNDHTD
nr:hypothetical protein [Tanacetum cinerariifolium]